MNRLVLYLDTSIEIENDKRSHTKECLSFIVFYNSQNTDCYEAYVHIHNLQMQIEGWLSANAADLEAKAYLGGSEIFYLVDQLDEVIVVRYRESLDSANEKYYYYAIMVGNDTAINDEDYRSVVYSGLLDIYEELESQKFDALYASAIEYFTAVRVATQMGTTDLKHQRIYLYMDVSTDI